MAVFEKNKVDKTDAKDVGLIASHGVGETAAFVANESTRPLSRALRGRHMQMIAIGLSIPTLLVATGLRDVYLRTTGGSIGAGLFVGSGGALHTGGPASLVC